MGCEPCVAREAEGVTYTSSDLAPGLRMFGCSRLSATLSTGGCSARWLEATTPTRRRRGESDDGGAVTDRFAACRGCPIGAAHSGRDVITYSSFFGASICPRCRKGTTRMIGGTVCVSCYNRVREMTTGVNARGNAPTHSAPLRDLQLRAMVNDRSRVIRARGVVDAMEPAIQTLRTTPGATTFSWAAPRVGLRQGVLFDIVMTPAKRRRPINPLRLRAQALRRAKSDEYHRQGLLFG